jgi:hypothetical protein
MKCVMIRAAYERKVGIKRYPTSLAYKGPPARLTSFPLGRSSLLFRLPPTAYRLLPTAASPPKKGRIA